MSERRQQLEESKRARINERTRKSTANREGREKSLVTGERKHRQAGGKKHHLIITKGWLEVLLYPPVMLAFGACWRAFVGRAER
jgi:hypothetical protein